MNASNQHELSPSTQVFGLCPVESIEALVERLESEKTYWGFWIIPTRVRLERRSAADWRDVLREPHLQEARIFSRSLDLHWLDGRGLVVAPGAGDGTSVGGDGWLERSRKSRLWGEWLEGTRAWYEERIPDPHEYVGLEPGPQNRFAFLRYREYLRDGQVRTIRYEGVEGGSK